jgi:hypothetical protein
MVGLVGALRKTIMTEITVAGATTLGQQWPNQDRMIVGEQYLPNVGQAKTQ